MSDPRRSLAVTYSAPDDPAPDIVEPPRPGEPTMDLTESGSAPPKKKRGRPKGSKNKKKRKKYNWFSVWRAVFWAALSALVVVSMYLGMQDLLGQSAAYITLAVTALAAGYLLDRDWKKMRGSK